MKCGKRVLSLILAVAVVMNMTAVAGAEQTEQTEQTEETSYRRGKLRVQFEDYTDIENLTVLCQEETGQVWVNGEDFVGNLANYSYSFDAGEKTAEIQAWNRRAAFQAGSSESAYAIGENECFYRMSAPALYYKEQFWIPADEFFYYLCCNVGSVSLDGDASDYDPYVDFLKVWNPNYTVLDVLYDIFAQDNGMNWAFTYEKDFGFTEKDIDKLCTSANVAVGMYDAATGKWGKLLGYASIPLAEAYNKTVETVNSLLGTELEECAEFYDTMKMEDFLLAMLYTSGDELEECQESIGRVASVGDLSAELAYTGLFSEIGKEWDAAVDAIPDMYYPRSDYIWKVAKETGKVNDLYESQISSYTASQSISQNGLKLFGLIATAAGIVMLTRGQEDTMIQSMEYFLNASGSDTEMPAEVRKVLENKFAVMKQNNLYAASETVEEGINTYLPDLILTAASMSVVGIAQSVANVAWYAMEQSGFTSLFQLARVSEPQALQLAMFGMMYESDAWRELASSYLEVALVNGLSDFDQVKDCAWLAANYLKACYVTTEAGLASMASAEFASSETYAGAKTKKRRLANMLSVITETMTAEEYSEEGQYPRYGILCNQSEYGKNEMTYEMFQNPSTVEAGLQYHYQESDLNAEHQIILPLVRFPNYYEFIRDELLPVRGYASTEPAYAQVSSESTVGDRFWDLRSGLLGADIADLNGDGTDDLLVYYYGEYLMEWSNDISPNCLLAELYTMDEDGEIYLLGDQCLDCNTDIGLDYIAGGLMDLNGKTFLYTEFTSHAYFANGDEVYYNFYEFTDEGNFLPRWSLGKTDGGSSEIAYSLLTRTEENVYEKLVLWADNEFELWQPEVSVYTSDGVSEADAVRIGFSMLSLPADKDVMPYLDMPSYFNDTTLVKPSFRYYCAGEGDSQFRNMEVTLEEYTELKEHIDALDEEG